MTLIEIDYNYHICFIESLLLSGICEANSSLMPLLTGMNKVGEN